MAQAWLFLIALGALLSSAAAEGGGITPSQRGVKVLGPSQNVMTVPLGDTDLNRRIEALALRLAASQPTRVVSNRGSGWQSSKSLHREGFPELDELVEKMQAPVAGLFGLPSWARGATRPADAHGSYKLQVNEMWLNVVNAGGENLWHNHVRGRHPGQIVAVYYVAVGNSGPSRLRLREVPDESKVFEVEPEPGLLAMLPAQMDHAVEKHKNITSQPAGPRISVAVNLMPRWFSTAAQYSALTGNLTEIKRLALTEKDVNSLAQQDNTWDGSGKSLLLTAVEGGHAPIAAHLLGLRADIEAKSSSKLGVLHYASVAAGNTAPLAAMLIAARADATRSTPALGGWEPLHHAIIHGCDELVELLLKEGADPSPRSRSGQEAIHVAAAAGRKKVASWLLEHRATLRAIDGEGREPIHRAAQEGHRDLVEFLSKQDGDLPWARVHEQKKSVGAGDLPIHLAASRGYLPIVEALGGLDGMLSAKGAEGRQMLHGAARKSHLPVVSWLLNRRADVFAKDEGGKEPLHLAAEKGHVRAVELLLGAGADPYRVDAKGARAIDLAPKGGDAEKTLLEHCARRTCGSQVQPPGGLRGFQGVRSGVSADAFLTQFV